MIEKIFSTFCFIALCFLTLTSGSYAQISDAKTWADIESSGYIFMDDLVSPLLYPALANVPYDVRALLKNGQGHSSKHLPPHLTNNLREMMLKLDSNDEFARHEVEEQIQPYINEMISKIKSAKGYIVGIEVNLDDYNFQTHRFNISIKFDTPISKQMSMNCRGAFAQVNGVPLTTCVRAISWPEVRKTYGYIQIDDSVDAQSFKSRLNEIGAYLIMEPVGKIQVLGKKAPTLRTSIFSRGKKASAVQTARVVGIFFMNEATNEVVLKSIDR